jgi:hypothetical protein
VFQNVRNKCQGMGNMFGLKHKKRHRIRNQPFLQKWQEILEKNVAYYHRLTPEDQARRFCGNKKSQ